MEDTAATGNATDGDVLVFGAGGKGDKAEQKRLQMEEKMRKRQEELAKKQEERKKKKEEGGDEEASDSKAKKPAAKPKKPVKAFAADENCPDQANLPPDSKSTFEIEERAEAWPKGHPGSDPPEPSQERLARGAGAGPAEAPEADPEDPEPPAAPFIDPSDRPIAPAQKAGGFDEDRPIGAGKKKQPQMSEYPEDDSEALPGPQKLSPGLDGDLPIRGRARPAEVELGPDGEPVLKTGAYDLSKLNDLNPFGQDQDKEEDLRKGPVLKRAEDKNAKKRLFAFEELLDIVRNDVSDPTVTSEAVSKFHKYIDDSNPATLEKAVEFVSHFILNGGTGGYETSKMVKSLIEKSITSAKESTKETALGLVNYFFVNKEKEAIFENINAVINKNLSVPKYVTAAYETISYLLSKHGPVKLDMLKPFVKSTVQAAGNAKPQTKEAAMNFIKEVIQWIGPAFATQFAGSLSKQQDLALQEFAKTNPTPTKSLSKKPAGDPLAAGGAAAQEAEEEEQVFFGGVDAYDLATAVDIFKQFNEQFFEGILALPKWGEKVAKINEFLDKAKLTLKFANVPVFWMSNILKRLFMDPNPNVQKKALAILSATAKGMRKGFAAVAKKEVPNILPRFKDTKLTEDIFTLLENFAYCMKPEDVVDDIKACLKEKHPGLKTNVIEWLLRCMKKDPSVAEPTADKLLVTFVEMTDEGDKAVRDMAMKFIGLVFCLCGEDRFTKQLSKVQANKMKSIQNFAAQFEKELESGGAAASPIKKTLKPEKPEAKGAKEPEPKQQAAKKARKEPAEAEDSGASPMRASIRPAGKNLLVVQNEAPRLAEPNMHFEEVQMKLNDLEFDPGVLEGASSASWEVKLESLKKTLGWLADNSGFSEEVMILLRHTSKGFTFSNPNYNKEMLNGLMRISEDLDCKKKLFNEPNVRIMVEMCVERLNDKAYLPKVQDLLIRCCSTVDPKAMLSTFLDLSKKKIAVPKICESLNDLLAKLIPILTAAYLPVTDLIEFSKYSFEQKNASIRKLGSTIICGLYGLLGNKVRDFLADVNQATMKTLDSELKKVVVNLKATPTIEIHGIKGTAKPADPLQVLPTADVSASLAALVPDLDSQNFQIRRDAIDLALKLLEDSSFNIKPSGLDGFCVAMARRVEDPHKATMKAALEFAAALAKSLGKHFKAWAKLYVPGLIKNLQDKQAAVRDLALAALSTIYEQVEGEREAYLKEMLNSLDQESTELKVELLGFINARGEALAAIDLKNYTDLIVKGLESKLKNLREGFEELLKKCVEAKGEDLFLRAAKTANPGTHRLLTQLLDRIAGREPRSESPMPQKPLARNENSKSTNELPKKEAAAPVLASAKTFERQPSQGSVKAAEQMRTPAPAEPQTAGAQVIPNIFIFSENRAGPGKPIHTSGGRKQRAQKGVWGFDGPNDSNLLEFYEQMTRHFSGSLLRGMFSLEIEVFQTAINELIDILQTQPEIFIDVQDLVLEWVFLRSFEARPMLTTLFIEFISKLLEKYAGANLLGETEKNLVVCASTQIYLMCHRYVDAIYFTNLFRLGVTQLGLGPYIAALEWYLREGSLTADFNCEQMLHILQLVAGFVTTHEVPRMQSIIERVVAICKLNSTNNPVVLACLQILAQLHAAYADYVEHLVGGLASNILAAVLELGEQRLASEEGLGPEAREPTNNQVIDEPDYGAEDSEEVDPQYPGLTAEQMRQRGMMDGFLNSFHKADDGTCFMYLCELEDWMASPDMDELIAENINPILENLLPYMQKNSTHIDLGKLERYQKLVDIFERVSERNEAVLNLQEATAFELFDTLLFGLIMINEARGSVDDHTKEHSLLTKITSSLNSTIIKVIGIAEINLIYSVLLDLLIKSRQEYVPAKFEGLVVKCLVKATHRIKSEDKSTLDLSALFIKMQEFMRTIDHSSNDKKENLGSKMIKTIINAIVEACSEKQVLAAYQAIADRESEDNTMKKWINKIIHLKRAKPQDSLASTLNQNNSGNMGSSEPLEESHLAAGRYRQKEDPRREANPVPKPGRESLPPARAGARPASYSRPQQQPAQDPRPQPASKPTAGGYQPQQEQSFEEEEPPEEAPEFYAEEGQEQPEWHHQLQDIMERFREGGQPVAQVPKLLKELTGVLRQVEEKVDMEPYLEGLGEKVRSFLAKELRKLESGTRTLEHSERKLGQSSYGSEPQDRSLRNINSSAQFSASIGGPSQAAPGSLNTSARASVRRIDAISDENLRRLDEIKNKTRAVGKR